MLTKKRQPKVVRMTENRRNQDLKTFVSIAFLNLSKGKKIDFKELSNKTQLSVSTLYRLNNRKFTLKVRFGTIQALGIAAGLRLEMTQSKVDFIFVD